MAKIIYVNQENKITPEVSKGETVNWEIDDDSDLKINVGKESEAYITIIPEESALKNPERILGYTINRTDEYNELELIIKERLDNLSAYEEKSEKSEKSEEQSINIPEIFTVSPDACFSIPGTENISSYDSWCFSNEKFNSYLKLTGKGVKINCLPPGFYSLNYNINGENKAINIQSVAKQDSQQENKLKSINIPFLNNEFKKDEALESPDRHHSRYAKKENNVKNELFARKYPDEFQQDEPKLSKNESKCWPKIIGKAAVEVSVNGQNVERIPIKKTNSLLIGKKSRSKKVVDIDLSKYSQATDKISKNHLKIWIDDEYIMMKNIGSHRVLYSGQEMFPDQLAVLKIGGKIKIGDIILTIINYS